ncbi:DoxX family membrane protein [Corynebacterium mendelii]|uniref:DoxX family membrane protein n=1 Tax=Corynebacterium mendelii TaxID=2765362 RepID=A0A939E3N1_9CORY|nr:DoxX family protein [Corynebacterium mendelii]MBN9644997.1 DoxX family membrane protein [Corynebacterium mendelii]
MNDTSASSSNGPDRAQPGDDIPTYRPADSRPVTPDGMPGTPPQPTPDTAPATAADDLYRRAGRAEPQRIEPAADNSDAPTAVFAAPGNQTPANGPVAPATGAVPPADTEATTAIPAVGSAQAGEQAPAPAVTYDPALQSVPPGYDPAGQAMPPGYDPAGQAQAAQAPAPVGKRGTIDFGLFVLRVVFAALLVFQALSVLFDLDGAGGLQARETALAGYAWPGALAIGLTSVELAVGVFLLLGLISPVAAAGAVVVTSFSALETITAAGTAASPLAWDDSVWLALMLVALAVTVQFTGPGRISADFSRGWATRPLASSWLFFLLGSAAAAALWWFAAVA